MGGNRILKSSTRFCVAPRMDDLGVALTLSVRRDHGRSEEGQIVQEIGAFARHRMQRTAPLSGHIGATMAQNDSQDASTLMPQKRLTTVASEKDVRPASVPAKRRDHQLTLRACGRKTAINQRYRTEKPVRRNRDPPARGSRPIHGRRSGRATLPENRLGRRDHR